MKLAYTHDHHHSAGFEWDRRGQKEWLTGIFDSPAVKVASGCTPKIRDHVESELVSEGWALNVKLEHSHRITVLAKKNELAFHLQTGNISRVPYDFLKFQYLFLSGQIAVAAIALPTQKAAKVIGSNIANADRIIKELELFSRVITVPILVIAFE